MNTMLSCMALDKERNERLFKEACGQVRCNSWTEAAVSVAVLAHALERHLQVEEQLLFTAFDRAFGRDDSPTDELRVEHKWIRGVLTRLADGVTEHDAPAFFKHAGTLSLMLAYHFQREARDFYPVAEHVLASQRACLEHHLHAFMDDLGVAAAP